MAPEAGVIDEAVDQSPVDPGVDPSPESSDPEPQQSDPAQNDYKPLAAGENAISDGKLSAAAKATLAEIRGKDPVLAKNLERALYQADALRRELPGGLKEVAKLRETIQTLGGPEGVQKTREELEYFNGLDQAFTAGDPKFLQAMTDTPEGKDAFLKLAPAMLGKYAELHPEGHAKYLASAFVADMRQEGLPLALEKIGFYLASGNAQQAAEILKEVTGYVNRVNSYAQKDVQAPQNAQPQNNDREEQILERERQATAAQWGVDRDRSRVALFQGEWEKALAGRKPTDVQSAAIKELYASRMTRAFSNIPDFNATLERYVHAGDRAGFLRLIAAKDREHIPAALRGAIDSVMPGKPGPKPAANGTLKANPIPAMANPATGSTWLPGPPKREQIDYKRTDSNMVMAGKAVLKTGKTVQWKV